MLWLLLACQGEEATPVKIEETLSKDVDVGIIYSNALIGEIEPCG